MRVIPLLDATAPGITAGRHSIWAPALNLKLPFSYGGRITKYRHREQTYDPADTIPHEIAILRALAAAKMAPPIGDLVYVETLVSLHPGGWHADPVGAWGFEMADANTLPPGGFSLDAMRALPIVGSDGAWGDVAKPGNVVNGYLVDVRRTGWDMLRWVGKLDPLPDRPREPPRQLRAAVHQHAQFPPGEREGAYQDFFLDGRWEQGERRVAARATALGFHAAPGESVLEIGCQAGGFLQLAWVEMGGDGTALGVEVNRDYVDIARRLARDGGANLCIRELDAVRERETLLTWLRERCPRGVDHLLMLSMEKHLGERNLFELVDAIGARRTYIETNAVSQANPWKLRREVETRGGVHVGDSTDRNLRRLYRIVRP